MLRCFDRFVAHVRAFVRPTVGVHVSEHALLTKWLDRRQCAACEECGLCRECRDTCMPRQRCVKKKNRRTNQKKKKTIGQKPVGWQILIFKSSFFVRAGQNFLESNFRHFRDPLVHFHCATFPVAQQRFRIRFQTLHNHRAMQCFASSSEINLSSLVAPTNLRQKQQLQPPITKEAVSSGALILLSLGAGLQLSGDSSLEMVRVRRA